MCRASRNAPRNAVSGDAASCSASNHDDNGDDNDNGHDDGHEEYLYKEQFKGLTDAEEAKKVGETVLLGGEVLEIAGDAPRKKMPAALAAKLKE